MTATPSLRLISFTICPFVQRSRILLNSKAVDYDIEYIDLDNKPDWFLERVPTGKVPALFLEGHTLFESAAINEYLDEITPGTALGDTSIDRALARAWISLSDGAIMAQFRMLNAGNRTGFETELEAFVAALVKFAPVASDRSRTDGISLLDAAIAPVFTRIDAVPVVRDTLSRALENVPQVMAWADRLLATSAVKTSVSPDFRADFHAYFAERGSFVLTQSTAEAT